MVTAVTLSFVSTLAYYLRKCISVVFKIETFTSLRVNENYPMHIQSYKKNLRFYLQLGRAHYSFTDPNC